MLKTAFHVGVFDLRSSLRSRKAVLLILLYLAGSVASSAGFVKVLQSMERTLADALMVAQTDRPGAMTASMMQNEQLLEVVSDLVGDPALAAELVSIPPVALFYGWIALSFVPVLVMLNSTDAVASEVESGSARFALVRSTRLSWALGKLLGQGSLLVVGLLVGGAGAWLVGLLGLQSFEAVPNAIWALRLSLRAALMGASWLGIALGISMLVRSQSQARALGMLALIGIGVLRQVLGAPQVNDYAPVVFDTLLLLFPGTYLLDLWQPALADRLPALLMLPTLGGCAFLLGLAVFQRRDA